MFNTLQNSNGGYTDFSPAMKFYELGRGIALAFLDFFKSILRFFGVDVGDDTATTGI